MPEDGPPPRPRGPLAWMTRNSVAANLLMLILVVGGLIGGLRIKQEIFPEFDLDNVRVQVPYPGASPAEVEQGIALAIEEAVRGIDGVKRVDSVAREGVATVTVSLLLEADPDQVLADVKDQVDGIDTFPEDAEEARVSLGKSRREVISLVLAGDQDLRLLHDLAEKARSELLSGDAVTQIELDAVPPLEVSIEVPRATLEKYGLSLQEVANQVEMASLELPGGALDTRKGEILVRVADRRKWGHELRDVILRQTGTGADVRLGDIAIINDGYEDIDQYALYDGKPAVRLTAYRVGGETPTSVADAVKEYAETLHADLPEGVDVHVWRDDSEMLRQRLDLLLRNAAVGLVLVVLILALFLDLRLAFWVSLGIPVSFLGAFLVLGPTDISINMISLFAFIVTLGMVVDDAIVVGERTYSLREQGMGPMEAAVTAAKQMATPVTFAILTTIAAFSPLFFVPGIMGKIFRLIPAVVVSVLVLSLIESFFVLPAHLAHSKASKRGPPVIGAMQRAVQRATAWFIQRVYRRSVAAAIRMRYLTAASALAILALAIGVVASGMLPFNFFPSLEGDVVSAQARLPYGSSIERTEEIGKQLEASADRALQDSGGRQYLRGMYTRLGKEAPQMRPNAPEPETGSHIIAIELNLVPGDDRPFSADDFVNAWRDATPDIAGLESLTFTASFGPGAGAAVAVQLGHTDNEVLSRASQRMYDILSGYSELTNIRNEFAVGKPQLDFHLRPQARALRLTSADVAQQIRSAFHGAEALREQRARNELKVVARLPEIERSSEHDLGELMIRTPAGGYVPLAYVAEFDRGRADTSIRREDGRRQITVDAELAPTASSAAEVLTDLSEDIFPELMEEFPGLTVDTVGQQREQREVFAVLGQNYVLALFVIFALLAVPFRSYIQPLVVMAVIPLGFVGAIAGHLLMGVSLSIMSMFGLVALSGVVVNDSLVLIDATNRRRAAGEDATTAIIEGGATRFRAILLTSLTTFFGLMPMIAETSVQAQFLIPMAISLGFGVLFVTAIVLVVVPALYVIAEDVRSLFSVESAPPAP